MAKATARRIRMDVSTECWLLKPALRYQRIAMIAQSLFLRAMKAFLELEQLVGLILEGMLFC